MVIPQESKSNFFGIKSGKLKASDFPSYELIARIKTINGSEL